MQGGESRSVPTEMEGLPVWVAVDGEPAGCLWLADKLKPDAVPALQALRRLGVRQLALLSGDASRPRRKWGAVWESTVSSQGFCRRRRCAVWKR